jgi:hypothetical protein
MEFLLSRMPVLLSVDRHGCPGADRQAKLPLHAMEEPILNAIQYDALVALRTTGQDGMPGQQPLFP